MTSPRITEKIQRACIVPRLARLDSDGVVFESFQRLNLLLEAECDWEAHNLAHQFARQAFGFDFVVAGHIVNQLLWIQHAQLPAGFG
jgi:hypothetical protein